MTLAEDMNNNVDDMFSSYDAGIKSMGDFFETTHQVLLGFRDSLLDDKAMEMGINWWQKDPYLSSEANKSEIEKENASLTKRLEILEARVNSKGI